MAKVKLTRHHNGALAGDTVDITDEQANYFDRVGLTEKEDKTKVKTKEDKTKTSTK